MAIQHRRGDYNDYRPNKMLSGELAVTLQHDPRAVDGKALHVAFAPGDEKTLMTFEDAEIMIEDATEIATQEAIEYASAETEAWAHGNGFTNNDYFSGDGTTTSFTLTYTPVSIVDVEISGSTTSAYSLSGKVLTFTTAPAIGSSNIRIEYTVDTTNDNAKKYKELAAESATNSAASEIGASGYATTATNQATLARSYTKGDTGTRSDEETDNAEYFKTQAGNSATSASGSATAASGSATTANNQRKEAEAWAAGTKDGSDIPSTDSQYHNNAKYWATLAAESAAILEEFAYYDSTDESIVFRSNEFVSYDVADESINISI